jgi:hypothetical protein
MGLCKHKHHRRAKQQQHKTVLEICQESGGIAPLKKGTNLISDSKGKAELLLNQFKSVFTKPTNNDLPSTRIQSKNNIRQIIIDQKDLEKLLTNINLSKASGPDNIPNRILKECAIHLAPICSFL